MKYILVALRDYDSNQLPLRLYTAHHSFHCRKHIWKALLLEWCSTPQSCSAVSPLYSENGILSMAFLFSGTTRSRKKPYSALIVSSRPCATARRSSFCSTDRSLGTNFAARQNMSTQNCM
ncbi:hypothetical protein TNCV_5010571 [Trichonephila clavipes]|nr:hypothetical protein TNCV_5010571 [Trichonephila clavipes]